MPRRGISVEVTVDDSVIDEAFECYFNNHIPESESDRNEMKRDREWRVKVAYALADAALALSGNWAAQRREGTPAGTLHVTSEAGAALGWVVVCDDAEATSPARATAANVTPLVNLRSSGTPTYRASNSPVVR